MSGIAKRYIRNYINTPNSAQILRNIMRRLECISTVYWFHFRQLCAAGSNENLANLMPTKLHVLRLALLLLESMEGLYFIYGRFFARRIDALFVFVFVGVCCYSIFVWVLDSLHITHNYIIILFSNYFSAPTTGSARSKHQTWTHHYGIR